MAATNGTQLNGDDATIGKRNNLFNSKVTVVLGAQWGDEGKGKVVDMLATDVDIVCRCQVKDTNFKLITLPLIIYITYECAKTEILCS